jgi:5'-methylthioadenosine phosphorylase
MPGAGRADVGVFGGSGFYEFLADATEVVIETPYGPPSAPITIGTVDGRPVAFLPRHGRRHEFAPHAVPYRANVWAMHELGVRSLLSPCACGSLQPDLHPEDVVVVDQLVDRTWGRADSFHLDGRVHHVAFADPYDAGLRQRLVAAGRQLGLTVHDGGALVVIQGPRFSTRAESAWFRREGWSVVNMTGYPEAVLAAELAVPFACIALVTDYDAGIDGAEPVSQEVVFAVLERNVARVRALLEQVIPTLP